MKLRILRDGIGRRGYILQPTEPDDPRLVETRFGLNTGGKVVQNQKQADVEASHVLQHKINRGWRTADGKPGPVPEYDFRIPVVTTKLSLVASERAGELEIGGANHSWAGRFVRFDCDLPLPEPRTATSRFCWFVGEEVTGVRRRDAVRQTHSYQRRYKVTQVGDDDVRRALNRKLHLDAQTILAFGGHEEPNWLEFLLAMQAFPASDIADVFPAFIQAYRRQRADRPAGVPSPERPRQIDLDD